MIIELCQLQPNLHPMKIDIDNEARIHLMSVLRKILDGNYTQNELENFIISGYQNEVFERIRIMVVDIINGKRRQINENTGVLNSEDRDAIKGIVSELEKLEV